MDSYGQRARSENRSGSLDGTLLNVLCGGSQNKVAYRVATSSCKVVHYYRVVLLNSQFCRNFIKNNFKDWL